ncbi:MAG: UDP-N-acetylglucosamine 1-carboxyvinyltransferase [Deltaproteobacteria bacterium]|nr:UDP-N-acetylglucosamine 1-carboxyvinyltransferase [Deltaproteobacteria bacterium]
MDKIVIQGGQKLKGKVRISGSKNAALPLMAAGILATGNMLLHNVPELRDIVTLSKLLEGLGLKISTWGNRVKIQTLKFKSHIAPYELVKTMRASVLVLGPLLARLGKAKVSLPGGCAIGARPIDQHLKALEAMGAKIKIERGYVEAECVKLKGANIVFDMVTVTGTENILMAACLAEGTTVLENAASEPEVIDLVQLLVKMGAKIEGAGTSRIVVEGVKELQGAEYSVMPDRIEAGTFMIAGAMTQGEILIEGMILDHVRALVHKLEESGTKIEQLPKGIVKVTGPKKIKSVDIITAPYPGFATDFQAQFMALMCLADSVSTTTETIFENRYMHVGELIRMGADIKTDGNRAIVKGLSKLSGAPIMATDLRASACLVLAGLAAEDITEISRVYHIDRGYEKIEKKFRKLGAKIKRVKLRY